MEISEKRLKELERAEAKLNALENYGVDNWEGYGDALTEYHQENAIDESYDELVDEFNENFFEFMDHHYPAGVDAGAAYDFSEEGYKWFVKLVRDHVEKIKSIESGGY